jgi:2,3-diketo-5-methylthio-1-phosphopentane phosphatase
VPPFAPDAALVVMLSAARIHAGNIRSVIVTNYAIGHLWTTGFSEGDLKTPLFEDVIPTLAAWKTTGKTLAIFSSGSVQAQLQFFSYVRDGESTRDIKHLFSAHYDTVNAGPKLEKASYQKICNELGYDVTKITFLTDNVKGTFIPMSTRSPTYHRAAPHP